MASFRKEHIWKKSVSLVKNTYQATRNNPDNDQVLLSLYSSATFISCDLTKAFSALSVVDKERNMLSAHSRSFELLHLLILAQELDLMTDSDSASISVQCKELTSLINSQLTLLQGEPTADLGPPSHYYAHPTAIIDEGATIGTNTKIWHFCHVMSEAIIGNECSLGQNVFVANGVEIGNNVKIQNNVSLYTGVKCQNDVFLGPSMVFTNVINPRSGVNRKNEYAETMVYQGVSIGANATIVCGNPLGAYAFIGAGTVITKPVPAYALMVGNPGRQIGWMSEHGYRLSFDLDGLAICPGSNMQYQLVNNEVSKIQTK